MMKGKIVEINKNSITIVTKEMKFIKVKCKENAEIGKEIFYFEDDVLVRRTSTNVMRYMSVAVLLLAMFIGVSTLNVPTEPLISTINFDSEVVAVVSLDINPSIEIELDKNLRVVNAIARNSDGSTILDLDLIRGKYITIAIKDMLKLAKDALFINDVSNTVLITTAPTDTISAKSSNELELQMKNLVMESSNEDIEYVVAAAPMSTLVEAREKEVSLGKLNVYEHLSSKDKDVSLAEIKSKKVVDIKGEGYLEDVSYEKFIPMTELVTIKTYKYIIQDGVEYGNVESFEKLGIKVNLLADEKSILASFEGHDDFIMGYKYGVLIKDGEYYYNLKDILDNFAFSFTYDGSKFVLDKEGANLLLDYVGDGIKSFESLIEIESTAVKVDSTSNYIGLNEINVDVKLESIGEDGKIKVTIGEDAKELSVDEKVEEKKTIIADVYDKASNYDMIISEGIEWIAESVFIKLDFEFYHSDKRYVRYNVISHNLDANTIGLVDGVIYYEAKSILDTLSLEYGYADEGFYIKTDKEFNLIEDIYEGEVKFKKYE